MRSTATTMPALISLTDGVRTPKGYRNQSDNERVQQETQKPCSKCLCCKALRSGAEEDRTPDLYIANVPLSQTELPPQIALLLSSWQPTGIYCMCPCGTLVKRGMWTRRLSKGATNFSEIAHFLPLDPLPHFCYFPALLQHKGAVYEILGNYRNDGRRSFRRRCRHDYNPTPPYYCQPACGCAPACSPPCNSQCAPSTTPYLTPTPTNIPRTAPITGAGAPSSGRHLCGLTSTSARPTVLGTTAPTYAPRAGIGYGPCQQIRRDRARPLRIMPLAIKSPSRAWPAKGSDGLPFFAHP